MKRKMQANLKNVFFLLLVVCIGSYFAAQAYYDLRMIAEANTRELAVQRQHLTILNAAENEQSLLNAELTRQVEYLRQAIERLERDPQP